MIITSRRPGHVIDNSIGIAASAEKVFDYVTDVRREPEWNPQLARAREADTWAGRGRHPLPGPVRPWRGHRRHREHRLRPSPQLVGGQHRPAADRAFPGAGDTGPGRVPACRAHRTAAAWRAAGAVVSSHIHCGGEGVYVVRHTMIMDTLASCPELIPWHKSSSGRAPLWHQSGCAADLTAGRWAGANSQDH